MSVSFNSLIPRTIEGRIPVTCTTLKHFLYIIVETAVTSVGALTTLYIMASLVDQRVKIDVITL